MSARDTLGFNFEVANLQVLKDNGFSKNIEFSNPTNFWQWKRHIGQGVDLVVQSGNVTYYIEESYCNTDYSYRAKWFYQCRLPRFRDVPETDSTHQKAILTNRADNFSSISWLLSKFSIVLLTLDALLSLLSNSVSTTRRIEYTNNTCMPMVEEDYRQYVKDMKEYNIWSVQHPYHERIMAKLT